MVLYTCRNELKIERLHIACNASNDTATTETRFLTNRTVFLLSSLLKKQCRVTTEAYTYIVHVLPRDGALLTNTKREIILPT